MKCDGILTKDRKLTKVEYFFDYGICAPGWSKEFEETYDYMSKWEAFPKYVRNYTESAFTYRSESVTGDSTYHAKLSKYQLNPLYITL